MTMTFRASSVFQGARRSCIRRDGSPKRQYESRRIAERAGRIAARSSHDVLHPYFDAGESGCGFWHLARDPQDDQR